jgi:hypothetical protein
VKEIWLLAVARLTRSWGPEPKRGYSVIPDQFSGTPVLGGEAEHPASEMPLNCKVNMVTDNRLGPASENRKARVLVTACLSQQMRLLAPEITAGFFPGAPDRTCEKSPLVSNDELLPLCDSDKLQTEDTPDGVSLVTFAHVCPRVLMS